MNKHKFHISFVLALIGMLLAVPLASAVVYTYDDLGRLTSVTYDNGQHSGYSYDPGGNLLAIDAAPPEVSQTDPANNAAAVPWDKNITVYFNESVQAGSDINGITINSDSQNVSYNYTINDNVLTLDPENNFETNVTYSVYIPANAVTDLYGNNFADDYIFSFTTLLGWSHTDTTQSQWQQGTMQKVKASVNGDIELENISDQFSDTALSSIWKWEVPKSGPTYSLTDNPGWMRITVPTGTTYNHWFDVNDSPKLMQVVNSGDWVAETKYYLTKGDTNAYFHTGIMVYFGPYDCLYWGPYRGIELRAAKDGVSPIVTSPYSRSGYLRIKKTGNTYYFGYKVNENDPWTEAGSYTKAETPGFTGLMTKTWNSSSGYEVKLDSDYFKLNYLQGSITSHDIDLSQVGEAQGSIINWSADTPQNSFINVETNFSLDGLTWQGWQPVTNNGTIPGITFGTNLEHAKMKYRATLTTSEIAITPKLKDITIIVTPTASSAPVIVSSDPQNGSASTPIDKAVSVLFSEDIQQGDNIEGITLGHDGTPIAFNYDINGRTLTIDPVGDLSSTVAYSVYIPSGAVRGLDGTPSANPYTFGFTTGNTNSEGLSYTDSSKTDWQKGKLQNLYALDTGELELGDRFNDSFTTNTLTDYTQSADSTANWTIDTTAGTLTASTGGSFLMKKDFYCKDVDIEVDVTRAYNGGLVARYVDGRNYYSLAIRDDSSISPTKNLEIYRRANSDTSTSVASADVSWSSGTPATIRWVVSGTSLKVYFNGVLKINITDTSYQLEGLAGFRQSNGTVIYNEIRAKSLNTQGNRVSPTFGISNLANAAGSEVSWHENIPQGTTLTIDTSLSLDGGVTWQAWQQAANGGAIPGVTENTDLSNAMIKYRANFTTTTAGTSAQLQDITFSIVSPDPNP
ncbi:MAG TPA: Ig-like domain-containing protein [Desulfobacteria bacterium]|nr:Ig-like domain-containing protein [Desulfobacteria bacterium]